MINMVLRLSPFCHLMLLSFTYGVIIVLWMINAVRNRMKSIKNIQKITKAMKMVAASKLRQVQTKTENSRGLWQPFTALLGDTPSKELHLHLSMDCSNFSSTAYPTFCRIVDIPSDLN